MTYKLSKNELQQITKRLPPDIQAFKDEYPMSVYNVSEAWGLEPLPHGYVPEDVTVYYDDSPRGGDIIFLDGELDVFKLREPEKKNVTKISVDDEWAYIQVGNTVLLDRLGEAILPDLLLEPQKLLSFVLAQSKS